MFDAEKLLGGLLGSAVQRHAGGADLGGLASLASPGKAGLAMGLLGVAIGAFEHFSDKQARSQPAAAPAMPPPPHRVQGIATPPPPPPGVIGAVPSAPPPPPAAHQSTAEADEAQLYVRAMIACAAADGVIDAEEREKILGHLDETGLNSDERDFLLQEMNHPASIAELARAVQSPEQAMKLYACSLLAIEVDTDAERDYLRQLAATLGLDARTLAPIHQRYQVVL